MTSRQGIRDSEQVQQPIPCDHKLLEEQGIRKDEIQFVEMPPPDMPGALAAKAIDAYFIGEPHAARAELDGSGRVLYYAKDIWPQFISCVLVAHESSCSASRSCSRPGARHRRKRGVGGTQSFRRRQSCRSVISGRMRTCFVSCLTKPPDRVSYRMLNPSDEEMQRIADMAVRAGLLAAQARCA